MMLREHAPTLSWRDVVVATLLVLLTTPHILGADTVQLSLRDGRVSIVADRATPAQILQAWSRQGDVTIVNAERMPAVPISLRLDNIPEEQALEVLLRQVGGYLARRRDVSAAGGSVFDRIVIMATPAASRDTARPAANAGPARPAAAAAPPAGIPQGPGVVRLVGPDGQPVEDDQTGAPPPPPVQNPGGPNNRAVAPPQPASPAPQTAPPSTSAPAGVPRPGIAAPAPGSSSEQPAPTPGQPRR